jgi:hypothetical protein
MLYIRAASTVGKAMCLVPQRSKNILAVALVGFAGTRVATVDAVHINDIIAISYFFSRESKLSNISNNIVCDVVYDIVYHIVCDTFFAGYFVFGGPKSSGAWK